MKSDRLGLWAIVGSLLAIAVVVGVVLHWHAESRGREIRAHAMGLTRAISAIPFEHMSPGGQRQNLLQFLLHAQATQGFAYGALVDTQGVARSEAVAPGMAVPGGDLPREPAAWFGERTLEVAGDGRRIREFYGPVLSEGHLQGFVRLGYFEPSAWVSMEQASVLGVMALPIFLLTPLFYFLVRREMRPMLELSRQIDARLDVERGPGAVGGAGDLREFVQRFSRFLAITEARFREAEGERMRVETSKRLLTYGKEKVESVLQALPEGVMVLDDQGMVTFANTKAAAFLGQPLEVLVANSVEEWCQQAELRAFLARSRSPSGRTPQGSKMEYAPGDGQDKRYLIQTYPLFAPRDPGRLLGTLAVLQDVTERMAAARARDEFIAHLSHELKTPLNTVHMYAEMLGDGGVSESERVQAVNAIHDESERMAMLINNLLSVSRIEMGSVVLERRRVRLHDLLKDAFDSASARATAAGVHMVFGVPDELAPVEADKELLRAAVNNLLTNAIKYNRPGGQVVISAEESEGRVVIRVTDNGLGIAPEDQPRIFDKFFRSADREANRRGGHGLGLYLVRQIVDLHHGQIGVRSQPGQGTEIWITLERGRVPLREAA